MTFSICVRERTQQGPIFGVAVDDNEEPVAELRRVYEAAKETSAGFSEDFKGRIFD
jgi:uncharacterized Ntn-hydrolase superfamily protein